MTTNIHGTSIKGRLRIIYIYDPVAVMILEVSDGWIASHHVYSLPLQRGLLDGMHSAVIGDAGQHGAFLTLKPGLITSYKLTSRLNTCFNY